MTDQTQSDSQALAAHDEEIETPRAAVSENYFERVNSEFETAVATGQYGENTIDEIRDRNKEDFFDVVKDFFSEPGEALQWIGTRIFDTIAGSWLAALAGFFTSGAQRAYEEARERVDSLVSGAEERLGALRDEAEETVEGSLQSLRETAESLLPGGEDDEDAEADTTEESNEIIEEEPAPGAVTEEAEEIPEGWRPLGEVLEEGADRIGDIAQGAWLQIRLQTDRHPELTALVTAMGATFALVSSPGRQITDRFCRSLLDIGSLPFRLVSRHFVSLSVLFVTAGILYSQRERIGNILVPTTFQAGSQPFIDLYNNYIRNDAEWINNAVPGVFTYENFERAMAVLYGVESEIESIVDGLPEIVDDLAAGLVDRLGHTREEVIFNANMRGLNILNDRIQILNRSNDEAGRYSDFLLELEHFMASYREDGIIDTQDLIDLQNSAQSVGIDISEHDGNYQWSTFTVDPGNQNRITFTTPPRRLVVSPTLSPDEAFEHARLFVVETGNLGITEALGEIPLIDARVLLQEVLSGEKCILVSLGEVMLVGANERYLLGPLTVWRDVFRAVFSEEFTYTELAVSYADGLFPVFMIGLPRTIINVFKLGLIRTIFQDVLVNTVLYPVSGLWQSASFVNRRIWRPFYDTRRVSEIFTYPFARLGLRMQNTANLFRQRLYNSLSTTSLFKSPRQIEFGLRASAFGNLISLNRLRIDLLPALHNGAKIDSMTASFNRHFSELPEHLREEINTIVRDRITPQIAGNTSTNNTGRVPIDANNINHYNQAIDDIARDIRAGGDGMIHSRNLTPPPPPPVPTATTTPPLPVTPPAATTPPSSPTVAPVSAASRFSRIRQRASRMISNINLPRLRSVRGAGGAAVVVATVVGVPALISSNNEDNESIEVGIDPIGINPQENAGRDSEIEIPTNFLEIRDYVNNLVNQSAQTFVENDEMYLQAWSLFESEMMRIQSGYNEMGEMLNPRNIREIDGDAFFTHVEDYAAMHTNNIARITELCENNSPLILAHFMRNPQDTGNGEPMTMTISDHIRISYQASSPEENSGRLILNYTSEDTFKRNLYDNYDFIRFMSYFEEQAGISADNSPIQRAYDLSHSIESRLNELMASEMSEDEIVAAIQAYSNEISEEIREIYDQATNFYQSTNIATYVPPFIGWAADYRDVYRNLSRGDLGQAARSTGFLLLGSLADVFSAGTVGSGTRAARILARIQRFTSSISAFNRITGRLSQITAPILRRMGPAFDAARRNHRKIFWGAFALDIGRGLILPPTLDRTDIILY